MTSPASYTFIHNTPRARFWTTARYMSGAVALFLAGAAAAVISR